MQDINVFALGGQDENGKNSHVIEIDNKIFVINAGIQIPINNFNGIDGIIPNFQYLIDKKDRIQGIFITHAHDENFAALPWLIMDIPGLKIYASKYTCKLIEERISKYKLGHQEYKIINLDDEQNINGVVVKSFDVATSIPGAKAFSFATEKGDILYMSNNTLGDLGPFGKTDLQHIKNNSKNILMLLLDSRIANFPGSSFDKKSIVPYIENNFKDAKQNERIIVGAFDEEAYTIHEVIMLAKKYNRPIISYGRAFDNLYENIRKDFSKDMPVFLDYKDCNKVDNAVILVTGTSTRLYKRFLRIALDSDVYLKFKKSDNIIMLAPPANGLEVEYADTLDDVARIAPNIIDVSDKDFYKLRPAQEDIKKIISTLKPKMFIPISSLYRYLVTSNKFAQDEGVAQENTILLYNGKIVHIKGETIASQKGRLKEFGDVIIDGFGVGDVSFEVIAERKRLATGGLVSISMLIDRKSKKPVGEINAQILGIVTKDNLKEAQDETKSIILSKIASLEKFDMRDLQNSIRKRVQKVFSRMYDKEPLVIVTFYTI